MNNEEKILEILTQMQAAQTQTNDRLAKLEAGQAKLEADVSGIKSDVSALKGDVSVLKDDVSDIKTQVNYIWEEKRLCNLLSRPAVSAGLFYGPSWPGG